MMLACFAVKQESRPFRRLLTNCHRTSAEVLHTGIGPRNARRAMDSALGKVRPRFVVSSGFAGALAPEMALGTLLYDRNRTRRQRIPQLEALGATGATFLSAERIATTAAEKQALHARSACDAIEMESEIIHQICASHGIECITLRVVSDTAHENLPLNFNALMTDQQQLSIGRLAWAIFRRPRAIPGLWRLGRNAEFAARQLARPLNALVLSP